MKAFLIFLTLFSAFARAEGDTAAATSVKTPNYAISYADYRYTLLGTNTANTNIYKFDHSTVDVQLLTATWMYSPKWTFMIMAPYIKNMVETIYEPVPGGANFKTIDYTEGFGDVRLMGMSLLWAEGVQGVLYDVSLSVPTGRTDTYFTSAPNQRAAYNMQPGSGTPDFIGGLNYFRNQDKWISSARGQITFRGGKNSHGYALGNELLLKANTGWQFCPNFNLGLQGDYKYRGRVQGRDERYELNNNYVGTPPIRGDGHQYYHSRQITWVASGVAKATTPSWKNAALSFEAGIPFWQDASNLDNIRLDIKYWLAGTLSASF